MINERYFFLLLRLVLNAVIFSGPGGKLAGQPLDVHCSKATVLTLVPLCCLATYFIHLISVILGFFNDFQAL